MKRFRQFIGVCVLGLGLAPATSWSQDASKPPDSVSPDVSPANTSRQRAGRIIVPEKAPIGALNPATVRPVRPELDPLSPEVKARVQTFERYANEYLKQQEEIRKRNKGTTDQDREKIRAQFKELQERWREQSEAAREQFLERRQELKDRLPSHRELLENAREQGREAIRDQRQRRGVDK
jgi:hypothetical protein